MIHSVQAEGHLLESVVTHSAVGLMAQGQHTVGCDIDDGCSKFCAIGQDKAMWLIITTIEH